MKADQISAVFWVVFSLFAMVGSYKLKLGTPMQPGAGFFPFLCSAFILLMSIIVLIQAFWLKRDLQKSISDIWRNVRWTRPLAIASIVAGYIMLLEYCGFVLTALGMLVMLLKTVEEQSWKKTVVVSLLAVAGSYLIFDKLLLVTLPMGLFGF